MNAITQTEKMLSRKDGGVGYLIFNNPERHNAVSLDMWEAAQGILADFAADKAVRVVVVTGAGGKAFVSGADISKFESERSSKEAIDRYNIAVDKANTAVYEFPKPTIAMIRGYCIGGGVGLALCCDLRICSDNSKFGVPAAKLGLGYGFKGIKKLVDVVGPSFAKEIFFTARQFTATEALTMGLVNRVLPEAELEKYVKDYAETISGNAPMTVNSVKFIVGQVLRPLIGNWIKRHGMLTRVVDRGSILLIVYSAFSAGVVAGIWSQVEPWELAIMVVADIVMLAIIMVGTVAVGRASKMPYADAIVLLFCGSKKSLASGLPMANILFAGRSIGLIVLPIMIFHQIQLFVCAVIAQRSAYRNALAAE